ncbi:GNAT family N-acetyltransferase [Nocardioides terrisoli]|uniref:GNAT family N-acetyltransferase n=1 Tax=Nocardioides terrisoli TaxID=3388267 RepID=UPI00287BB01B|nr:GNAT family N-acetyltransferase [Nocardioides marmorisolisilvae]
MASYVVTLVDPPTTLALRQQVLRPHQSVAEMAAETDAPGALAVAAVRDDLVLACAMAAPEALPEQPASPAPWRIRGMATAPEHRRAGLGSQVLERLLDEVRLRGGRTVWCNARVPARGLYLRAGFAVVGEPWEDPVIGPHLRMWRAI